MAWTGTHAMSTIEIKIKNSNFSDANLLELDTEHLDGKTVDLPHQNNADNLKAVISERLIGLIDNGGLKGMFKTAIRSWVENKSIQPQVDAPRIGKSTTVTLNIKVTGASGAETNVAAITARFYYVAPPKVGMEAKTSGKVHPDAVDEIGRINAAMRSALTAVFSKTLSGRSAPGTTRVNHFHVGGIGTQNLLFYVPADDSQPYVVLGFVEGHMDKSMSATIRQQAKRVDGRAANLGKAEDMELTDAGLKKL